MCTALFNPDNNPHKRCCDETERAKDPIPNHCSMCIECCDETERTKKSLPSHCSKCRRCYEGKIVVEGKV